MMALVYGGSGSGKSTFAENIVTGLDTDRKTYLATMQVFDDEGRQKVKRHQDMRSQKGFDTVEAPRDLPAHFDFSGKKHRSSTVLLECMSNLVANEMFREDIIVAEDKIVTKVSAEVLKLGTIYENVVIVSNNIFEDGLEYDNTTLGYMRALSKINQILAKECDEVWEIVAGIPIRLKGY